jgi:hypothetical protein
VESARCASLEVAIDEQYFARAGAVLRLVAGWTGGGGADCALDLEALGRKCHKALDIMRSLSPLSILTVLSISVDLF